MKTKGAIEFIKYQKYSINEYKKRYANGDREDCNKKLDEVADMLKRGENFEKMWEELKKVNPPAVLNFVENCGDVRTVIEQSKILRNFSMYKLKQKYFPKEEGK